MTRRAPSWARMMSSIPSRSAVPGATRPRAERSFLSFRGSARTKRRSDRLAKRPRASHSDFATSLGTFRDDHFREAELRAFGEPSLALRGCAQTAGQPDLAETGEPGADGRPARGRCNRDGDPEVGARLVDPDAACDVHEYVRLAERHAGVPSEHGDDHREPLRVDASAHAPRHGKVGWRHEGLDLEQERAGPLERARHGRPDLAFRAAEELGRVDDPVEPFGGHLEHADLVRRAEAVLDGAQNAVLAVAIAFELEHAVDEVLEDTRPRDGAVLRHVTDEERRDA